MALLKQMVLTRFLTTLLPLVVVKVVMVTMVHDQVLTVVQAVEVVMDQELVV